MNLSFITSRTALVLFVSGTTLKGKNLLPRGSKFFPLRAVLYGMVKFVCLFVCLF